MAVLDLEANGLFGENLTGKLYIATDYDGAVFPLWDGTNEKTAVTAIEADYIFADVWYFENFATVIKQGDERIITTDYCEVGEISRKVNKIPWFTVDVQEILEMDNLALILWVEVQHDTTVWSEADYLSIKNTKQTNPYQLFKFVTCPKDGNSNTFYFVKCALASDVTMPVTNLQKNDFVGVSLEFDVADSGNMFIKKQV